MSSPHSEQEKSSESERVRWLTRVFIEVLEESVAVKQKGISAKIQYAFSGDTPESVNFVQKVQYYALASCVVTAFGGGFDIVDPHSQIPYSAAVSTYASVSDVKLHRLEGQYEKEQKSRKRDFTKIDERKKEVERRKSPHIVGDTTAGTERKIAGKLLSIKKKTKSQPLSFSEVLQATQSAGKYIFGEKYNAALLIEAVRGMSLSECPESYLLTLLVAEKISSDEDRLAQALTTTSPLETGHCFSLGVAHSGDRFLDFYEANLLGILIPNLPGFVTVVEREQLGKLITDHKLRGPLRETANAWRGRSVNGLRNRELGEVARLIKNYFDGITRNKLESRQPVDLSIVVKQKQFATLALYYLLLDSLKRGRESDAIVDVLVQNMYQELFTPSYLWEATRYPFTPNLQLLLQETRFCGWVMEEFATTCVGTREGQDIIGGIFYRICREALERSRRGERVLHPAVAATLRSMLLSSTLSEASRIVIRELIDLHDGLEQYQEMAKGE